MIRCDENCDMIARQSCLGHLVLDGWEGLSAAGRQLGLLDGRSSLAVKKVSTYMTPWSDREILRKPGLIWRVFKNGSVYPGSLST